MGMGEGGKGEGGLAVRGGTTGGNFGVAQPGGNASAGLGGPDAYGGSGGTGNNQGTTNDNYNPFGTVVVKKKQPAPSFWDTLLNPPIPQPKPPVTAPPGIVGADPPWAGRPNYNWGPDFHGWGSQVGPPVSHFGPDLNNNQKDQSRIGSDRLGGSANYGGPRQFGGPVDPSQSYTVGENGPERFVPHTPGSIVPTNLADRLGGMGMGQMRDWFNMLMQQRGQRPWGQGQQDGRMRLQQWLQQHIPGMQTQQPGQPPPGVRADGPGSGWGPAPLTQPPAPVGGTTGGAGTGGALPAGPGQAPVPPASFAQAINPWGFGGAGSGMQGIASRFGA